MGMISKDEVAGSDARLAPERSLALRASITCLPLSALPVTGFGGTVLSSSGFGHFRHARVSGNAHKSLNFQEETHHG